MDILQKNVKNIRESLGITQTGLAEKIYVTQQTISDWENGRKLPQIDKIYDISNKLESSVSELLYENEKYNYILPVDYSHIVYETHVDTDHELYSQEFVQKIKENCKNGKYIYHIHLSEHEWHLFIDLCGFSDNNNVRLAFWKLLRPAEYKMKTDTQIRIESALESIYKKAHSRQ